MLSVGDKVGNYTILKMLGQGGMGEVYLGEHRHIARKAAIKVIRHESGGGFEEQLVSRFFTEARAASLIQHPGIVEILDCDVVPNGPPFIVMEYLEGEGLESCLVRAPRMGGDVKVVALVLAQVADALAAAHAQGIVHRDLKPANIFLVHRTHDPALPFRAKVLDFGIAKLAASAGQSRWTQTGTVLGTPVYMSPEQCRGAGAVDHRADIYSLGCVAYEMLTGQVPFVREGNGELIVAHISEDPTPILDRVPSLPAALARVVERMLAKRAEDRPQTMQEVAQLLRTAAALGAPTASTLALPAGAAIPQAAPSPASARGAAGARRPSQGGTYALTPDPRVSLRPGAEQGTTFGTAAVALGTSGKQPPRRRGPIIGGAILGVAGLAGVVAWYVSSRPVERLAPPPPDPVTAAALAEPAGDPVREPVREEPHEVKIVVRSSPPGARVWIEGERQDRGPTPLELSLKASPGELRIRLERDGHGTKTIEAPGDRDGTFDVQLEKIAAKSRPSGRPRPSARPQASPSDEDYRSLVEQ